MTEQRDWSAVRRGANNGRMGRPRTAGDEARRHSARLMCTPTEFDALAEVAAAKGYRSVNDYLRGLIRADLAGGPHAGLFPSVLG